MFLSRKRSIAKRKLQRNNAITDIIVTGIFDIEMERAGVRDSGDIKDDDMLTAQAINYYTARAVTPEFADRLSELRERAEEISKRYQGLDLLINYTITDKANWLRIAVDSEDLKKLPEFPRIVEELKKGKELYPNDWSDKDFEKLLNHFAEKYNPSMQKHVQKLFTI